MRRQLAVRPERGECARPIAEICRRLDGLPLALELAAARMAAFAPAEVVRRLDNVLRIASGGPRNAPLRQQTLEATIAWSYALLDESERSLYRRLAVFAGGFSLDGAQAVAADDLDAFDVLPTADFEVYRPGRSPARRRRPLSAARTAAAVRLCAPGGVGRARERPCATSRVPDRARRHRSALARRPAPTSQRSLRKRTTCALPWAGLCGAAASSSPLGSPRDCGRGGRGPIASRKVGHGSRASWPSQISLSIRGCTVRSRSGWRTCACSRARRPKRPGMAESVREYAVAANDCVLAAVSASVVSAALAYLGRACRGGSAGARSHLLRP